jgi:hypothetical protein
MKSPSECPKSGPMIPNAGSINSEVLRREACAALNALQSSQDRATATQAAWVAEYLRRKENTLEAFLAGRMGR